MDPFETNKPKRASYKSEVVGLGDFHLPKPLGTLVLEYLEDKPRSLIEILQRFSDCKRSTIENCPIRLLKRGLISRTRNPIYLREKVCRLLRSYVF